MEKPRLSTKQRIRNFDRTLNEDYLISQYNDQKNKLKSDEDDLSYLPIIGDAIDAGNMIKNISNQQYIDAAINAAQIAIPTLAYKALSPVTKPLINKLRRSNYDEFLSKAPIKDDKLLTELDVIRDEVYADKMKWLNSPEFKRRAKNANHSNYAIQSMKSDMMDEVNGVTDGNIKYVPITKKDRTKGVLTEVGPFRKKMHVGFDGDYGKFEDTMAHEYTHASNVSLGDKAMKGQKFIKTDHSYLGLPTEQNARALNLIRQVAKDYDNPIEFTNKMVNRIRKKKELYSMDAKQLFDYFNNKDIKDLLNTAYTGAGIGMFLNTNNNDK